METHGVFRFGVFELDASTPELTKHGIRLKLPPQAITVLVLLISRSGATVTRQELRALLWPDEPYGDHDQGLHKLVSVLRDALGDSASAPRFVETVPRVGYRFLAPVTVVQPVAPAAEPALDVQVPSSTRRSAWTWIALSLVLSAAALVLAPAAFLRRTSQAVPVLTPRRLTAFTGAELYPVFSPDGNQIAFAWDGGNRANFDIYAMEVNSEKLRRVTRTPQRDYCPVWSPDGGSIAFLRTMTPNRAGVFLIRPDGTEERKVTEITRPKDFNDWHSRSLAWTHDPDLLVIRDSTSGSPFALSLLSIRSGDRRVITAPPINSDGDDNPAVSADGRMLAFTRRTTGLRSELFVVGLSNNPDPSTPPLRLTTLDSHIESPAWQPDGRGIVFAVAPPTAWVPHLMSVPASGGPAREISAARIEGLHPAFAPDSGRLVYVRRSLEETSIWRAPVPAKGADWNPTRLLASTEGGLTYPNPSPDGKRITFRSLHSGSPEVWVADADGANAQQLTHVGGNGAQAPRWSPDGKSIAYESRAQGASKIWIVNPDSGIARQLTTGPADDILPAWSRDSRRIYFASTLSGRFQIWTVPASGGTPVQITRNGGSCGAESPDSQALYFTAGRYPDTVRKIGLKDQAESEVISGLPGLCSFTVTESGIFYVGAPGVEGGASLNFQAFGATQKAVSISIGADIHRFLSGSPDGRFLFYSQTDRRESDLMLVDRAY